MVSDAARSATPLTVPELLAVRAAEDPDALALAVDGYGELSFHDWQTQAVDVARGLVARGMRRGDRVGLIFEGTDWTAYAVAFCGVQQAGGVSVPLSPGRGADDLHDVLAQCQAVAVLRGRSVGLPPLPRTVAWTAEPSEVAAEAEAGELPPAPRPDDLAQILFTSGTTGRPKGVGAPHANLTAGFVARAALRPLAHSRHAVHAFPIGTNAGQTMLVNALVARPVVVAMARFDAARFGALVSQLRAGTVFLVPAMAIDLLRSGVLAETDLSCVRLVGCTAAPLPAAVAAQLAAALPQATVVNYYTSTEAAPAQTTMVFDPRRPSAVGRPAMTGDIAVRADDGTPAGPGQPGTVWLRSPSARHYVDVAAATAAVFAGGWVRMGDLGYLDADGYLHLVDRESDVIVTGAHKVSSLLVEEALHDHPGVVEAAVVPVGHAVLGATVGAVVVTRAPVDLAELRVHLAARLARHEVPAHLAVVGALPRNEGGKVRKAELAELLRPQAAAPGAMSAAQTASEQRLAVIWRSVLRTAAADDVAADFFALGGDSLRAAQIATAAEQAWQVAVSVDDVFARPSVRALAAWLDGHRPAPGTADRPVTGPAEPSAMQRVWLAERAADPPRRVVPIHLALRIDGPFDHTVLRQCLAVRVRRHDALHTPVGPAAPATLLHTEHRSARTGTDAVDEAAEFVTAASEVPVRALTVRVAAERHVLALSVDHLRCDGWSMGVLLRELGLLYSAARAGGGDPLRPPAASAAEAVAWAREQWPRHRGYWQQLLATPVADPVPMRGQDPRPHRYGGASFSFTAGAELVRPLRAVAHARRSTLMRVTLAVWAAALRKVTGSAELAFVTPLTGRVRPEWEQVVGCLIQQPVLRVPLGDDPAPGELLDRVHRQAADAAEHQFYPVHEFTDRVAHPAYFFYEPWARLAHLPGLASAQVALPPELGLRWSLAPGAADLSPPRLRLTERAGDLLEAQLVYNRHALGPAAVEGLAEEFLRTCRRFARIGPADAPATVPALSRQRLPR